MERAAAVVVRTLTAYGDSEVRRMKGSAMYMSAACSSANLHCGYENGEALCFPAVIDVIRNLQRCSTWKEACSTSAMMSRRQKEMSVCFLGKHCSATDFAVG